ncbi:MAG: SAM-dependent methyltransferase [Paludibacteraceae bacterium]|nr:SAM-dependent methyltransferase [Paludibacteraceae bacterium]
MTGTLYLIPNTLGDCNPSKVIPSYVYDVVRPLRHFIVEDIRTARRYLRKLHRDFPIDDCSFLTLNQHTDRKRLDAFLTPLLQGHDVGVISEAGCPAVADPGADVVALAQRQGIQVVPLVGPSSILLAQMASGFNGQSFAFVGYLPIEPDARSRRLRQLEARAVAESQTQLFIETPYRNQKLYALILNTCSPKTRLCVATDITLDSESIRTHTIAQWKTMAEPELNHRPTIFAIFK